MQVLQSKLGQAAPERRGAAMMLAFLVLSVLMLIVFQIAIGTSTDSRVANNALQRVVMDEAIESALLKTMQDLADDAAAGADAARAAGGGQKRHVMIITLHSTSARQASQGRVQ